MSAVESVTADGHTPGPWGVFEDSVITKAEIDDGGDIICDQPNRHYFPESAAKWTVNAQLIAAAPDLLEALRKFLHWHGSTDAVSQQARAAIAKATSHE